LEMSDSKLWITLLYDIRAMIMDISILYFNNCPRTTSSEGRKRYTSVRTKEIIRVFVKLAKVDI